MKLIEKIKNVFKHSSEYLKNEKEEILNGFSSCDQNISKIYFDSVSNEEFSFYKLNILQKRLFNVLDYLGELANSINSHNKKCLLKQKTMLSLSVICLVLEITSGIIFLGNPIYLLFLGGLLYFVKKANDYKKCRFTTKEAEEIHAQAIYNSNTMMNSIDHIEKKKRSLANVYKSKGEQDPYILVNFYANKIIEKYLDKGIIGRVPYYIESEIVYILQTELKTDEVNMYTLLDMARTNFNSVGVNDIIKRTREKKESD